MKEESAFKHEKNLSVGVGEVFINRVHFLLI